MAPEDVHHVSTLSPAENRFYREPAKGRAPVRSEPLDLNAQRALDEAASPGPWHAGGRNFHRHEVVIARRLPLVELTPDAEGRANAAFIAEARTSLPALVAIVEEVRRLHGGPRTERHGSGCVQCGIVWPCPTVRVVGIGRGGAS